MIRVATIIFMIIGYNLSSFSKEDRKPSLRNFRAVNQSPTKEQLMDDPEVSKLHKECQQKAIKKPDLDIGDCIWQKLPQDKKDYILEKGIGKGTESEDLSTSSSTTDPAVKKLEDYFFMKLKEAMYDTARKETKRVIEKEVFYDLYESQVSKNIIASISSYCLDANNTDYLIEEDEVKRKAQRQKNIDNLSVFAALPGDDSSSTNIAYQNWSSCLLSIPHICHKTIFKERGINYAEKVEKANFKNSNKRACLVTKYIKGARRNLIQIAHIKEGIKKHTLNEGGIADGKYEVYVGAKGQGKSIDELTTVTSNELGEPSGFEEENTKLATELKEECIDKSNEEICGRYIASQDEAIDLNKAHNEYSLKTKAMEEKLKNLDGKEAIVEHLKQEKRSDKEIEQLLAKGEDQIKKEIYEQYKEERAAVLAQMRDKLNTRAKLPENNNAAAPTAIETPKSNIELLANIEKELKDRPQQVKELIFFNNMVSGYMTLKHGETSSKNTQTIYRELENSAFDPGRNTASADGAPTTSNVNFKQISEQTKENVKDLGENSDDNAKTNLDVNTINSQILKYQE